MLALPEHLHPMVVHFPIALFTMALILEVISLVFKKTQWHQTAVHMYVLAALFTPFAILSGIWETEKIHLHHPLLEQHHFYAHMTMGLALATLPVLYLVQAKCAKYFRIIFLVMCLSVVGLIAMTADKGGDMVYEYGVGVEK